MKTVFKQIVSIMLAVIIVFGSVPLAGFVGIEIPELFGNRSIVASAANLTLNELKSKFPDGKYWNHMGSSSNNPNGWTNTPCSSHSSTSTCNGFVYNGTTIGWQCFGFALKLGYDAYGTNPKNWGRAYNLDSIKPGDIINYNGNNPGHTVFVIGVNGDTVTFAECNFESRCEITWGRSLKKSQFYNLYNVYVAPYALDNQEKILKVYFNANGGSISSDTYKLSSNVLYNKDDSTKYYQKWTYNNTKENGLVNWETFGIYKKGYTFAGWGTKASGGTVFSDNDASIKPSDMSSEIKNGSCSITLYAQWKPNTLKVYYNANGASISSDTYKISSNVVCNKSDGSKFIQSWSYNKTKENGLTNHSTFGLYKSGYTFAGWGTKASGGTVYSQGDNTLVPTTLNSKIKDGNCSLTLYAQWVPNTLKVYYNVNGASITSDTYKLSSNLIYTKSDSTKFYQKWTYNNTKENGLYNASSFGIYKTGYHFAGWGTKASGGTIFDQNDAAVTPLKLSSNIKDGSQSITLYAQWVPNTVNVYYNVNGGTVKSDTYNTSSSIIYKKSDSTKFYDTWIYNSTRKTGFTNASTFGLYRTGYTFAGWSTKASSGTIFDQNDTTIVPTDFTSTIKNKNCSVTMYAQWVPNKVTLHYQSAGELLCKTHAENSSNSRFFTTEAIDRTSATQLKCGSKTYAVTGSKTSTLTYGVTTNAVSISEAGLSMPEHLGCGYIAYRDYDDSWRVRINDTLDWCTSDEINKAISNGTFDGYAIYSQTSSLTYTAPKGNIYFYAVWVNNHTHSYTLTDTQNATCTEKEIKTYTCSCGDSYQTTQNALGHEYAAIVTAPTCTDGGYTTHTCSRCLDSYINSETDELGHSYVKTVVKEPTCVEEGMAEFVCSACSDKFIEDIDYVPHRYVYTTVAATCTTNGYTQTTCEMCGETIIDNYVEPKEHTMQAHFHMGSTCTTEGFTENRCTDCSYTERVNFVPAKGHSFGAWNEVEKATYRLNGLMRRECINCTVYECKSTPKLDFSGTCPDCSETFTDVDEYDAHIRYENEMSINRMFYKIQITSPSVNTINYGDRIILHAALENELPLEAIPNGWRIEWTVNNDNFARAESDDGKTFTISPNKSGDTTVTVTLYDENKNVISEDTQVMTSKAGFFDKLIAFFKKLFGLTKVIAQSIDTIN